MSSYIRGGGSNYGNGIASDLSISGVQAAAGETIFFAVYYADTPDTSLVSSPTWNGENFTEIVNRGAPVGDEQQVLQVFFLTTTSSGTYDIVASNAEFAYAASAWAVYSGVSGVSPIELEEAWSGYTNPSLTISGTGTVLNVFAPSNWDSGYSNVSSVTWSPANGQTVRQSFHSTAVGSATAGWAIIADVESSGSQTVGWTPSADQPAYVHAAILIGGATTPTTRKGSTFDIETTLGTITTATLSGVNVFDHVSQAGTTVSFAGAATDDITTSGEYSLVLGDGVGTETITVQVNVVGLASFNINKDGADQGSLTDVEFIILTGAAGSRAINDQIINVTTTVGGDTGAIEITDAALNAGDTIMVAQRSDTVSGGGGAFHPATLGLI